MGNSDEGRVFDLLVEGVVHENPWRNGFDQRVSPPYPVYLLQKYGHCRKHIQTAGGIFFSGATIDIIRRAQTGGLSLLFPMGKECAERAVCDLSVR
jgi:hypothetical protein